MTPVPGGLARPLVESLVHEVVCDEHDIAEHVPDPPDGLIGFDRAVRLALRRVHDARRDHPLVVGSGPRCARATRCRATPTGPAARCSSTSAGSPSTPRPRSLWRVLEAVGGERGWYSWGLAWRVRGLADRLVGGPGLRRGRRDPLQLLVDDAVDFWRVEEIEEGTPAAAAGRDAASPAWRGWSCASSRRTVPTQPPRTSRQRALFHPKGLLGQLYWWSVYPFHGIVFGGMQRNIARAAETAERARTDRGVSAVGGS